MSNTTTKVLAGCAVGCLLIVLALGGLGWMGYRWARTAAEVVEAAERAEDRLEAEYGLVREFTPPADGRVAADRIEAFLAVRELMAPQRASLNESVEALAPAAGKERRGWRAAGGKGWDQHGAPRCSSSPGRATKRCSKSEWGPASTHGYIGSPTTPGSVTQSANRF